MIKKISLEHIPEAVRMGNAVIKNKLYDLVILFDTYDVFKQRKIVKERAEKKYIDECKYFDKVFGLNTV